METTYYTETVYTQEEFEDIVFGIYKEVCQEKIDSEPISLCYPNINFLPDDVLWNKNFKKKMETKGFYELNKKLTGYMFFDITCDGFFEKIYNDVTDTYNQRIGELFHSLDIDESCWDNDCPHLKRERYTDEEFKEEMKYARCDCSIHRLKAEKVHPKSCDNCYPPYYDTSVCEGKTFCEHWHWNGE